MLPALYHLCDPLRGCLQCVQVSPTREPRTGQSSRCGFINAEQRARITSLGVLAKLLLLQPRSLLAVCAATAPSWFMLNSETTRTARFFLAKLLSIWVACSMHWCLGLCLPHGASPFAELPEVPVSPFLQLLQVPLEACITFGCLSNSFLICLICKLAEVTPCSSI